MAGASCHVLGRNDHTESAHATALLLRKKGMLFHSSRNLTIANTRVNDKESLGPMYTAVLYIYLDRIIFNFLGLCVKLLA